MARNEAPALEVNWTTPHSEVTINWYHVQYRRGLATSWSTAARASVSPPKTSAILTGLDAGTEYTIRVRAVSAVSNGEWSNVWTERTYNSEQFNAFLMLLNIRYHELLYSTSDLNEHHIECMYIHIYLVP